MPDECDYHVFVPFFSGVGGNIHRDAGVVVSLFHPNLVFTKLT